MSIRASASRPARGPVRVARFPRLRAANPYLGLLYGELTALGVELAAEPPFSLRWLWKARHGVDLLHFHWRPDRYYALARTSSDEERPVPFVGIRSWIRLVLFAVRLAAARRLGYQVAWTIHEVYPPETSGRPPGSISRRIDRIGGRLLAGASEILLAHDESTADRARTVFGPAASGVRVIPHPSYLGVYPPGRPRSAVRAELGIAENAFAFLCFGRLRPDKEIELLVQAFCGIPDGGLVLVVAGRVEHQVSARLLEEAASCDPRIVLRLGIVRHDRVRELFEACDVAVFPRGQSWTSGSLILALSLGVPAVSARVPPYDELLGSGKAGWLFEPDGVESLRAALLEAAAVPSQARAKGAAALKRAESLPRWDELAARTAEVIHDAVSPSNGSDPTAR